MRQKHHSEAVFCCKQKAASEWCFLRLEKLGPDASGKLREAPGRIRDGSGTLRFEFGSHWHERIIDTGGSLKFNPLEFIVRVSIAKVLYCLEPSKISTHEGRASALRALTIQISRPPGSLTDLARVSAKI